MLPLDRVVGTVTWQIESEVDQANGKNLIPWGSLENCLFVPVAMRPQVIHSAHTSLLTCNPGIKRTIMEREVREYVEACSICVCNKTSSAAQMGLL